LQHILQRRIAALKDHVHSILQQDIRNYDGREINKLDLSTIPKQAYERSMHPTPKDWFHFPTELTTLSNMFTPSSVQLAGVSHLIRITFTLKKPYISLDDDAFYIIDNPVVKDTVLKVPIIRPTTLKGALRYAAMKTMIVDSTLTDLDFYVNGRVKLVKLFGSEKGTVEDFLDNQFRRKLGEKEGVRAVQVFKERMKQDVSESGMREGRLIFYSVFFDSIGWMSLRHITEKLEPLLKWGLSSSRLCLRVHKGLFRFCISPLTFFQHSEAETAPPRQKP
jgi:hypothetical protein